MPSPKPWIGMLHEVCTLAAGRYPAFVYAPAPAPLSGREVPVFMFHAVHPETFERQLRHLAGNGYHTPTLDAFHAFLAGRDPLPPASVLLTFDDVERSLLTVGIPLLKRYGLRAAAFLVPGRMGPTAARGPSAGGKRWPDWADVAAMADSGVIDFGSHTLNHAAIFVADRPVGFVHPGCFVDGLGLDNPVVRQDGCDRRLDELGAPLFPTASRMARQPRYYDDEAVRASCVRFVAERGGADFFRGRDWRRRLETHWRSLGAGRESAGRREDAEEQAAAIRRELIESRQVLEERLGRPVLDFAYPWAAGSDLAVELSRAAGYRTNFWGPLPGVRINRAGQDPMRVARLKDDYLLRLPGRGRISLSKVLLGKARRRRACRDIY
jgi:peptidoglycan/xylan/chitin deacetylase (PgdA/CDA1 family)